MKDLQCGQTGFPVNWKSKGLIGLEFNIFWQEHILKELSTSHCVPIPRRLSHLDAARVDPFFFFSWRDYFVDSGGFHEEAHGV